MFIQVIQGTTNDADGLNSAVQRWVDEIAPHVKGWLGTTGGTTADGRTIAVVRFESEDAANQNNDRPQQQQWWAETSGYFDDVTFHNCTESFSFLDGGSDDAGFVQVIQGRTTDVDRMRNEMTGAGDDMRAARPDVIGGTVALHGDGGFTQVVYFTSEEAARAGEQGGAQREQTARDEEMASMFADATYFDLTRPSLHSPK